MSLDADAMLDRRRLKRRLALWRTIAIVVAVALIAVAVGRFAELGRKAHVARVDVSDLIIEDHERDKALISVAEDGDAMALIVRINSPGGTTAGSEALYLTLRRVAEEKPVVAVIGTLGASGAYLSAIAADHVIARETSITGSIGVVLQTAEITGLLEKLGISADSIKSAPLKAGTSPLERLSDQARQAAQGLVDDTHRWFVELVARRRKLEPALASALADGRVYTGRQALEKELIDGLGGEQEARQWLESVHDVPASLSVVDVQFGDKGEFLKWIFSMMGGKTVLSERLMLDGLVSVWHP